MTILQSRTTPSPGTAAQGCHGRRRRLSILCALTTALLVVFSTFGTPAWAASAGDPDQGTPPCDTLSTSPHNVTTMADPSTGASMGTAYLVYSAGCQTEWVTVHVNWGYAAWPSVWLQNQSGTDLYEAASLDNSTVWTYQLADMKYQTACGGVQMYRSNGSYVNWNYLGCY